MLRSLRIPHASRAPFLLSSAFALLSARASANEPPAPPSPPAVTEQPEAAAPAQTEPSPSTPAPSESPPPARPESTKKRPQFIGAFGGAAGSSAWRGDPVGFSALKLGFRFFDFIAPYYLGRLGYGEVNNRSILTLSFGVQAWAKIGQVRPYARVSILHQHEESLAAIKADVGGALTGVGDGIRHRSGPEFGFGFDLPLHREKNLELVGCIESSALYFPDPRGPSLYVLGSLALGLNYTL